MARLQSHPVTDSSDIRAFFDALSGTYREAHGDARALLEYRLALIESVRATCHGLTAFRSCDAWKCSAQPMPDEQLQPTRVKCRAARVGQGAARLSCGL